MELFAPPTKMSLVTGFRIQVAAPYTTMAPLQPGVTLLGSQNSLEVRCGFSWGWGWGFCAHQNGGFLWWQVL